MKIIKIFSIIVAIIAAGLAAQLSMPVEAQPSRQAECSYAGVWSTSYGQVTLDQLGNVVNGTYGTGRRVQGTVLEGLLTGSWSHPPTYSAENNQAGDIEFLISANCESFEGSWRYGSTGSWTNWNGTLSQRGEGNTRPPRQGTATACDFNGTWDTTYGEMTLEHKDTNVSGTYTKDAGRIEGVALGNVMTGRWSEAPSYSELTSDAGDLEFELSTDCNAFFGKWRFGPAGGFSSWDGTRVGQQTANPWEGLVGPNCFEQWIGEAMGLLNGYDGGAGFNAQKPWGINEYGNVSFTGMTQVFAPDDWAQYGANKYWRMWALFDSTVGWGNERWDGAKVPFLRPYVLACIEAQSTNAGGPPTGEDAVGEGQPWEHQVGVNCFEQWIGEAMGLLNNYSGDAEFESRKPYGINEYANVSMTGMTQVSAPDDWAQYGKDRYQRLWALYDDTPVWGSDEWNGAQVPLLHPYVLACIERQSPDGGGEAPTGGGTGGSGQPWEDQVGVNCFEQWIQVYTAALNSFDGSVRDAEIGTIPGFEHNAGKPYSINKWGNHSGPLFPFNEDEPSDWAKYGENKYQRMWNIYPDVFFDIWVYAGGPRLHTFVLACIGGQRTGEGESPTTDTNTTGSECSFAGVWSTTYNTMTLVQSGTSVTGTYGTNGERKIAGTFQGGVLRGQWSAPPTFLAENNDAGEIEFTLSADRKEFEGKWRYGSSGGFINWTGTRTGDCGPIVPPAPPTDTITTETALSVASPAGRWSVPPGGTVRVPVALEKAERVGSMNFTLTYDAAVVRVTNMEVGNLVLGIALMLANTEVAGIISFGVSVTSGQEITGGGHIAYVEFTAVGAEGSSSALTLGDPFTTNVEATRLSIALKHGRLTIEQRPPGDFTGNRCVGVKDALAALQMSVGERTPDLNLDMDRDGSVTAEDARLILREAVTTPCATTN